MRQNRIKKFLTAGLSGLLILSLTGCGQAAKLPETVENTSLVVEKDGKVTSYLVNTFDKDFYNLDGLTQMVEEEAEEFNATHTEATENPMNVKNGAGFGRRSHGAGGTGVRRYGQLCRVQRTGPVLRDQSGSAGTGTHGESGTCKRSGRHSGGF